MDRTDTLNRDAARRSWRTRDRTPSLRILIAPSGFKESLDAGEAAESIAIGIRRAIPSAAVTKAPLVDGGEGFSKTLASLTGGSLIPVKVSGPQGGNVRTHFAMLGGMEVPTAALEIAAAAGLRLVPKSLRNPLASSTRGVGQLISAALDAGARHIIIGCGDSGTNDGGAGLAQALGVRLLDGNGHDIGQGGGSLLDLRSIDISTRDPRLDHTTLEVCCNWKNILCGPQGVARMFGPQKGASPQDVKHLAAAMDHLAAIVFRDLGIDVATMPGSGASGGTGAGLHAFLGAILRPRYETMSRFLDIDGLLRGSDLVIVAEGSLDDQTPHGKMPVEISRRAKRLGIPVLALAGILGRNADENYLHGIDAFESILCQPCTRGAAMKSASVLLENGAERAMRLILLGRSLPS